MSALYSSRHGKTYVVPTGGLVFSLVVYFGVFVGGVIILVLRRRFLGGELGGPRNWAIASSIGFMFLYFLYLLFSCLGAYQYI